MSVSASCLILIDQTRHSHNSMAAPQFHIFFLIFTTCDCNVDMSVCFLIDIVLLYKTDIYCEILAIKTIMKGDNHTKRFLFSLKKGFAPPSCKYPKAEFNTLVNFAFFDLFFPFSD